MYNVLPRNVPFDLAPKQSTPTLHYRLTDVTTDSSCFHSECACSHCQGSPGAPAKRTALPQVTENYSTSCMVAWRWNGTPLGTELSKRVCILACLCVVHSSTHTWGLCYRFTYYCSLTFTRDVFWIVWPIPSWSTFIALVRPLYGQLCALGKCNLNGRMLSLCDTT